MTQTKTKKALLMSVLSMVLCVAMLVGMTFAWFTDTASTAVNKIQAGELKIKLLGAYGEELGTDNPLTWAAKDEREQEQILWEPNCEYNLETFKVQNAGNLAVKYKVILKATEIEATANGKTLLDVLEWKVNGTNVDFRTLGNGIEIITDKQLLKGRTDEIIVSARMKAEAGNDYQGLKIDGFGVEVYATQLNSEKDSYGPDYDKFAEYDEVKTVQIPAGDENAVNDAMKEALANAVTTDATGDAKATQIVLPAGATATIESGATKVPQGKAKDIKISGGKNSTLAFTNSNPGYEGKLSYQDGANLTFQGITVDVKNISGICARGGVVTFIDCTIVGELKQTIASKFVFSGCEFTSPVSQLGYGCRDVILDKCNFNTDGYGIKIYSEGNTPVNLTVKNSAFKNTGSAAKSAIFLDHIVDGITYNITVDNCTFDGFTAIPTPNYNRWATRIIVEGSFVKSGEQYVFSYQTGEEGGNYHKILTADQLVVTVK